MVNTAKGKDAGQAVEDSYLGIESKFPLRVSTSEIIAAGSGLLADGKIKANEEIFRIAQPLVTVLSDSHLKDTCDNCFRLSDSALQREINLGKEISLSACGACKVVRYCSKLCQKKAWKKHHKAECKIFDEHRSEVIAHLTRATMRLVHLRMDGHLTDDQWSTVMNLKSHKEKVKVTDTSFWPDARRTCQNIKIWTNTDMEQDILEDLICIFVINSMTMESPEGTVIGSCLDPFAALMNHSCDPNSAFIFEGPELRVRSTRSIAKGEEITIAYTDPTESLEFRQKQLSNYHFFCKCKKCEREGQEEWNTRNTEPRKQTRQAQRLLRDLLQCDPKTHSPEDIEAKANQICREFHGQPWPHDTAPMPSLKTSLAIGYREQKNLLKAYSLWVEICFKTDPAVWESQYSFRRVEHFLHYISVEGEVANLLSEDDSSVKELEYLKSTVSAVQYPHVVRFAEDARKAYGNDSGFAEVARIWEQRWNDILDRQGMDHRRLALYWASNEGKLELKKCEQKLLDWADNFGK